MNPIPPFSGSVRRRVSKMKFKKQTDSDRYAVQTKILGAALATSGHSLDQLLAGMKEAGVPSLYLSGTRVDNDYCFGSVDLGFLFSVLPEDGPKAAVPGYHPHGVEVYVTFKGSLVLETLEEGRVTEHHVDAGAPCVIPRGRCHRVQFDTMRESSSAILKTNVGVPPGVVRCESCEFYEDRSACPLHQRWKTDNAPM